MKSAEEIIEGIENNFKASPFVRDESYDADRIKRAYRRYYKSYVAAEEIQNRKERYEALKGLLYMMIEEYRPTSFSQWVHDLAYEFSLYDEYRHEDPPYSSINTSHAGTSIYFTQAKMLLLYHDVRESCILCNPIGGDSFWATEEKPKGKGKTITIKNIIKMGGLLRYETDEDRQEYNRKLNNRLLEYNKMAQEILKTKEPDAIAGLIELIEHECGLFFDKRYEQEWYYTLEEMNDEGVTRRTEVKGPFDYEYYRLSYNSPKNRKLIQEILEREPYKKRDTLFSEFEIQTLHTALKTELKIAEKLKGCKSRVHDKSRPDATVHFSKRVSDEELKLVYDGLIENKMLCDNPTLEDFIFWHTGSGKRPSAKLKWAVKNVCRYYVQRYLDSEWETAEGCFMCKNGKIKNLCSATNIRDDNRRKIDEILEKARPKATKITTKTD